MEAATTPHPNDQTLCGFGLGTLDGGSASAVHAHLENCPRCRERVAAFSGAGGPASGRGERPGARTTTIPDRPSAPIPHGGPGSSVSPEAHTLDPGLAEHPDYERIRELGRGGMGVVYLAHNRLMGRDEVLKVMGRRVMDRPGVFGRFLREIRAVARLRHENIVTAYSATRLGEGIAFAMEYVDGLDLARMVRAKGPLPVALACNFAYQAALGLQHAHEEGFVHRDIKPGNLMLTRKGRKATVKVLDFGLAKAAHTDSFAEPLTQDGQTLGTPDFIAPEQITSAQTVDIRADIYSLGATLYYLLTARPPFRGRSLYEVFQGHLSREPEPLILLRPEVPPDLPAVVARMMAKDPAGRFQTPRAAAQALMPFFRGGDAAFKSPNAVFSPDGGRGDRPDVIEPSVNGMRETRDGVPGPPVQKANASTAPEVRWESLIEFREADEPEGQDPAASEPTRRAVWVWPSVAVGVLTLVLLAGLLAFHVRAKTDQGELVFDELPGDAVVTVDGKVIQVDGPGSGGPAKVAVAAGDHSVTVEVGGVEVAGDEVRIRAGDQKWVRVKPAPDASGGRTKEREPAGGPKPGEVAGTRPEVTTTPQKSTQASPAGPIGSDARPEATGLPAAVTAMAADVLYADTFDDPASGWAQEDPEIARKEKDAYHFGYDHGVWFNSGSGSAEWSKPCAYPIESEFQLTVLGRILDATPESRGRWTVHVLSTGPNRRGFQVTVERNGVFTLEPSFWDRTSLPSDPRIGPVVLPGFRTGTEFNALVLRVRKRQVEVLCNGNRVGPPITFDRDLAPCTIQLGVDGYQGSYRAEFDRVEIKKLVGESADPGSHADALQPGSVWLADPGRTRFTVLEREGERIKARLVLGSQVRELVGEVKGSRLRWLARDVRVISGKPGGDHEGEIRGGTVDMTWSNPGGPVAGKYTLKLSKPAPAPADDRSTAARTRNLLFLDEFDDPRTGWARGESRGSDRLISGHGYRNGVYFVAPSGDGEWSYQSVREFGGDFQVEVSGRVVDASPESHGFWVVHILPTTPDLRGIQVRIDRSGALLLEPTFWHRNAADGDPRFGPIPVRDFRRGSQFNTLAIRVRKRQAEVLVNSARVGPVVPFGWDLSPALVHLGLHVEGGGARAEFDRIEVKELRGTEPADPKR